MVDMEPVGSGVMRPRIPGTLDVHALALLAHRPDDVDSLRREALRLTPGAVRALLVTESVNVDDDA